MVRIAGSRQENIQHGDELYSLSYIGSFCRCFSFLTRSQRIQNTGCSSSIRIPDNEEYVMRGNGEGNVSQTFLTETYRDLR